MSDELADVPLNPQHSRPFPSPPKDEGNIEDKDLTMDEWQLAFLDAEHRGHANVYLANFLKDLLQSETIALEQLAVHHNSSMDVAERNSLKTTISTKAGVIKPLIDDFNKAVHDHDTMCRASLGMNMRRKLAQTVGYSLAAIEYKLVRYQRQRSSETAGLDAGVVVHTAEEQGGGGHSHTTGQK